MEQPVLITHHELAERLASASQTLLNEFLVVIYHGIGAYDVVVWLSVPAFWIIFRTPIQIPRAAGLLGMG
jgi:hypothetical protein